MRRLLKRSPLSALLSGLLLAACGGMPDEAGLAPFEESLGTRQEALCSGLRVTSLTLSGISTYQGEMAGNGNWALSTSANAVRLEYSIDGVLRSSEERVGTYNTSTNTYQGAWYFSTTGVACGPHTFTVKAWPMVIDSAGNRTTCWDSPTSLSQSVTEPCPDAWLTCTRKTSTTVECTGTPIGGVAPYTPYWKQGTNGSWFVGSMTQSFPFVLNTPYYFRVRDAAGNWSPDSYFCSCTTTSCNICS